MKAIKITAALALASLALFACKKDNKIKVSEVNFTASVGNYELRLNEGGNGWTAGDQIGIYATNAGGVIPNVVNNYANIPYKADKDGASTTFSPVKDAIEFKNEVKEMSFVAYYPYAQTISENKYDINVATQSPLKNIDLLYSSGNKASFNAPQTALKFKHALSKICIELTTVDINGDVTLTVNQAVTTGKMTLADGTIELGHTKGNIDAVVKKTGDKKFVTELILVPGQDIATTKFAFKVDGKTYTWTPEATTLESGKLYKFRATLNSSILTVVPINVSGSIQDWEETTIGSEIEIHPDNGGEEPQPTENIYGVDLTQVALSEMAEKFATTSLPAGWVNKSVEGNLSWEIKTFSNDNYAQISGYKKTAPKLSAALVTPKVKGNKLYFATKVGHANGASLSVQLLNEKGAFVKELKLFTPSTPASGFESKYTKHMVELPGTDCYIAFLYKGEKDTKTTTFQIDNISLNTEIQEEQPTPPTPVPAGLAFAGGNFEDWATFTGNLSSYGLGKDGYQVSQVDGGKSGKALKVLGKATKNSFIFTVMVPGGKNPLKGKSKIHFYINGKIGGGKSLSLQVYVPKGTPGTSTSSGNGYFAYNLGDLAGLDVTLTKADKNSYNGNVDTKGAWVKVSLDISDISSKVEDSGSLFAVKVGKQGDCDFLLDEFTVE